MNSATDDRTDLAALYRLRAELLERWKTAEGIERLDVWLQILNIDYWLGRAA